MKTMAQWLAEYGESHRHPTNKAIHWVCVPLILFSVLALLWAALTFTQAPPWRWRW